MSTYYQCATLDYKPSKHYIVYTKHKYNFCNFSRFWSLQSVQSTIINYINGYLYEKKGLFADF